MSELKTRRPTAKPPWPMVLLAGVSKAGKSYSAAQLSASDLVDRTFFVEVGEGAADAYGAIPGARFEIVEHDGTFNQIGQMVRAITKLQAGGKPHAIVVDSMTEVWDLLADEQQVIANQRRKTNGSDAPITMDQWNNAKKRWRRLVDVLREHQGPVVLTARLEKVATVDESGKPTAVKDWKIRAEKNLPFEVDAIVEMPEPRRAFLSGVRSLELDVPPGAHVQLPEFSLDGLLRKMGLDRLETSARAYVSPNPAALSEVVTTPEHEELRTGAVGAEPKAQRVKPSTPAVDEWTTPAANVKPDAENLQSEPANVSGEQTTAWPAPATPAT